MSEAWVSPNARAQLQSHEVKLPNDFNDCEIDSPHSTAVTR